MRTLLQDVRYGLRVLTKNPAFTAAAVLTLALGVGANVAIFSLFNGLLLRPLPYPESERLVRLWDRNESAGLPYFSVSIPNFFAWREQSRSFEALGAYREDGFNLLSNHEPVRVDGARATADLFEVLGVPPLLGRTFSTDEDSPGGDKVVLLTHGLWQRLFGGDPGALGSETMLDGALHTVIGIMPADFQFPQQPDVELIVPYALYLDERARGAHFLRVLGRLERGVTPEQAQTEMEAIAGRLEQESPDINKGWTVVLLPLLEATVGSLEKAVMMLLGAVAIVLLIACANIANLLLARSMEREREMAVRVALGAGRAQIVRQLLTESVLLALLGGGIGVLIAAWGLDAFSALGLSAVPRPDAIRMDGRVLGFALLVSVSAGALFGLLPALHVARGDLQDSLRGRTGMRGASRIRLRGLLVVSEVALAVTLVIGAGLLLRSFANVLQVEPGFDPTNVLAMEMTPLQSKYPEPQQRIRLYQQTIERLETLPGVQAAGAVHRLPLTGNSAIPTFVEGRPAPPPDEVPSVNYRAVSPGYFDTLQIPLIRGRLFTGEEGWETGGVVLINQAMAKNYWPSEDPLGARLGPSAEGPWLEVIGVVGDVRESSLDTDAEIAMYLPYLQAPVPTMTLLVRTEADPLSYVGAVRAKVKEIDSAQAVSSFMTLDDFLSNVMGRRRFDASLLSLFASLALILAAVGIYGLLSYSVSQRTRELGIRMAIGAPRGQLLRLVLGQGMVMVMVGLGLGLVAGALCSRLLGSFLFGVTGTDPVTLSASAALLVAVSLLACYLPARRATRVDPVVALRLE